jgi:iron complex outermembrane receptor protein
MHSLLVRSGVSLLLFILFSSSLLGQQLEGYLYDNYTQAPVGEVHINVSQTTTTAISDSSGYFIVFYDSLPVKLQLSHVAYQDKTIIVDRDTSPLQIHLQTTGQSLSEIKVKSHNTHRPIIKTAGSVRKLSAQELQRFNNTSIQPALNTVPGVKMESRGEGGSRRISVRGSVLRSPWGVRNINVYWNGIPLTSPDGSSPLELIDAATIAHTEVIKGPTSSLYGAGTGGTLLFESQMPDHGENSISQNVSAGTYAPYSQLDYYRSATQLKHHSPSMSVAANYVKQNNQGYRQQEFNNKDFLSLHSEVRPNTRQTIQVHALHYDGSWGLPGALTISEMAENPQQADAYSVLAEAAVHRTRNRLGLVHDYQFSEQFSNKTVIYGNTTDKENPYGTSPFYNGYKIESAQGTGGRTEFSYRSTINNVKSEVLLGTEWQFASNQLKEYTNETGDPGQLYQNSQTLSQQYLTFAQWELEFDHQWFLTLGASHHQLIYKHEDRFTQDTIDYSGTRQFSPNLSPRLAVVKGFGDNWSIHGSISRGFSAPTLWEVSNPDGSINTNLEAEKGINYEVGTRGSLFNDQLNVDVSGYLFRLQNAIVPENLATGTVFHNRGVTQQYGLEAQLYYLWTPSFEHLDKLKPWASYARQAYYFENYIKNGQNLEGNQLTGVPPHMLNAGLDLENFYNFSLNLHYRFVASIPITDANDLYTAPYHLVNAKLSYEQPLVAGLNGQFYFGVRNLLNTKYSSFLQLNGFGGKYYNPAPGRSFYGGVQLNYSLNKVWGNQ